MEVFNIVEKIVWDNIDVVLKRNPEACGCDRCRADMAAYALNKIRPRYVVTEKGAVMARALSLETGFQIELLVVLTEAMKMINANPRH
jgi:competence protein ComFB